MVVNCKMTGRLQVGAKATPSCQIWIDSRSYRSGYYVRSGSSFKGWVKQVPSQITESQSMTTYHTGPNGTMSICSEVLDYPPEGVINLVTRGANPAFLGDRNSVFSYDLSICQSLSRVSGDTVVGPLRSRIRRCQLLYQQHTGHS